MATAATPAQAFPAPSGSTLRSWITTVDHKRIGLLYLLVTMFFFLTGGLMALVIRLQLETASGTVVSAETYDQIFTMHGTTMIFLVGMPLPTAFGNYLIPLQIGARDVHRDQGQVVVLVDRDVELAALCQLRFGSRLCQFSGRSLAAAAMASMSAASPSVTTSACRPSITERACLPEPPCD